jgi:hypothetical protein
MMLLFMVSLLFYGMEITLLLNYKTSHHHNPIYSYYIALESIESFSWYVNLKGGNFGILTVSKNIFIFCMPESSLPGVGIKIIN